jgi:plastocyanin
MKTLLLALGCTLAVSCGGSAQPASTATPAARGPSSVVQVAMRHIRFVPERVTVRLGQTVRWSNDDAVAHTVAAQDPAFASDAITAGQSYTYRPRRKGVIHYFCTIHANQNGELVVR